MQIVVRGWSKDHGETEIIERDLLAARQGRFDSYSRGKTYVTIQSSPAPTHGGLFRGRDAAVYAGVDVRTDAKIILNGDYLVRISFDRFEIADMFFSLYRELPINEFVDLFNLIELRGARLFDVRLRERVGSLPFPPIMLKLVNELELSDRSMDCLKNAKIVYIGDLVQMSEAELLRLPNCGRKSLSEIKEVLASLGLHLGKDVPGWQSENIEALARLVQRIDRP
jgi:hypothetical protein